MINVNTKYGGFYKLNITSLSSPVYIGEERISTIYLFLLKNGDLFVLGLMI
jgi:hypothetical protein